VGVKNVIKLKAEIRKERKDQSVSNRIPNPGVAKRANTKSISSHK
jgi:hypothetical protein